jgi:hypothetical protein
MPSIFTKTFATGVLVPDGWQLIRSLRGRGVYAHYSESDVEMTGSVYVATATAGLAIVQQMALSTDEELTGLLTKLSVNL